MKTLSPEIFIPEESGEFTEISWSGCEPAHQETSDLSLSHEVMRIGRSEDGSTVDFYRIGSDGNDGQLGEIDQDVMLHRAQIYKAVKAISKLDALLIPDIEPMELHTKALGDWDPEPLLTEFDEEQLAIRSLIQMQSNNGMRQAVIHKMIRQAQPQNIATLNDYIREDRSLSVAMRKVDSESSNEFKTVVRLSGLGAAIQCVRDPKVAPIHYVRPVLLVENKFTKGLQPADGAVIDLFRKQGPQRHSRNKNIVES